MNTAKIREYNQKYNFATEIMETDSSNKQLYAVKDMFSVKGSKTTAASAILKDYTACYDATVVMRANKEYQLAAKLNQDEFAQGSTNEYSYFGSAKNPKNKDFVTGGSSGGSASIVALDLVDFALGTDTGGSVRNPASYCGVIGFKPTYGAISRYGVIAMASSFDTVGILSKSIQTINNVFNLIKGADGFDSTIVKVGPKLGLGRRIAIPKQFFTSLDTQVIAQFDAIKEVLLSKGFELDVIDLDILDYCLSCYYILVPAEVSSNMARFDGLRYGGSHTIDTFKAFDLASWYKEYRSQFGNEVKRRIGLGNYILSSGYFDAYYRQAAKLRHLLIDSLDTVFNTYDYILGPTTPTTAPEIGVTKDNPINLYLSDIMTVLANLVGSPAISLPLMKIDGMPLGLQLMSQRCSDIDLLAAAGELL